MIFFIASIYIFKEYTKYNKHKELHKKLNSYQHKHNIDAKKLEERIHIICDDIENDVIDSEQFVKEMFNGANYNEIFFDEIYDAIMVNLYSGSHDLVNDTLIKKIINSLEKKLNATFCYKRDAVQKPNKYVGISSDSIVSWYRPIIFDVSLKLIKLFSEFYFLFGLGFKRHQLKDGVVIWVRKGNENGILFVPACIGGITFYPGLVRKMPKDKTIFIPEIPGMSWNKCVNDIPPSVSHVSDLVTDHIVNYDVRNLIMIGHSFGTILNNHIANEQYNKLKSNNIKVHRIIYVEGLLFYAKVFETVSAIEKSLFDVINGDTKVDVVTMPLFQRDLYVKFYIKRCLGLTNSLLSGSTDCEKECEIHAVMCDNDNKFSTNDYIRYIEGRKLPMNYKVFKGFHGSFVLDYNIQNYVIDLLK